MAHEITSKYFMDANVSMSEGSTGVFDITLDDKVIFSKNIEQRFPNDGEVLDRIEANLKEV